MTGQEIWDFITSISTNKAIYEFANILKNEGNRETLLVGIELLSNAEDLLLVASDSESLRTAVLSVAKDKGSFAGFPYVANELLPVDDENHQDSHGGLSWVAWGDLWDALETVALSVDED